MPTTKKLNPLNWIYITLGGFILFTGLAILLVIYGKKLEMGLPVYFFLLVVVALSATGFLTGALRSQANYTGNVFKGKLYLAGPALVFVIILFAGYKFKPTPATGPLTLTINVFGPSGRSEPITNGSVTVMFENDARVENISSEGQAIFGQVSSSFKGKTVRIIPQVKKHFLVTGDTAVLLPDVDFPVIDIQLQKQKEKTLVRGLIVNQNGLPVSNAIVKFQALGKSVTTNEQGSFEIELPLEEGSETDIVIFVNNVIKYRNKMTVAGSKTIPIDN